MQIPQHPMEVYNVDRWGFYRSKNDAQKNAVFVRVCSISINYLDGNLKTLVDRCLIDGNL